MHLKAFSIHDTKGEVFHTPFFKKTHGEAERDFTAVVRDPKSQISQFPEDYDLYYVGDYDDQTGKFQALDSPRHVLKAAALRAQ